MRLPDSRLWAAGGFMVLTSLGCYDHHQTGWPGHMMDYGYGYGSIIMWIILLIPAGLVIYLLWAQNKRGEGKSEDRQDPGRILKQRYARGDITKEEFERIKRDLEE